MGGSDASRRDCDLDAVEDAAVEDESGVGASGAAGAGCGVRSRAARFSRSVV